MPFLWISWLPKRRFHLPLRLALSLPFMLQTAAIVGIVGYLSYRSGQQSVEKIAFHLMDETGDRVDQKLTDYLAVPHLVNASNAAAVRLYQVDTHDFGRLGDQLYHQFHLFPSLQNNFFVSAQKELLGYGRYYGKMYQAKLTKADRGIRHDHLLDANRNPVRETVSRPFDPTTRPWYRLATQVNRPAWTEIYPWSVHNDILSLTAVLPYRDSTGAFQGVFCADVLLVLISDYLNQINVSENGQIWIIERSGNLVATSTLETPFIPQVSVKSEPQRLPVVQSQNAFTREVAQQLLAQVNRFDTVTMPQNLRLNLPEHGETFTRVLPFRDEYGLDWLIVIAVPESDFLAEIYQNVRSTALLCAMATLSSLVLGYLIAHRVTRPLMQLNVAAKRIAEGDLELMLESDRPDELGELARSFDQMVMQLKRTFARLNMANLTISEGESRMAQVLESVPIGVALHGPDGSLKYLNSAGKALLQIADTPTATADEIAPTFQAYRSGSDQLYPTQELPAVRALNGEQVQVDDIEIRHELGTTALEVYSTPVFNHQGDIVGAVLAFLDITARRESQRLIENYTNQLKSQVAQRTAAFRASEERFRRAFEDAAVGMAIVAPDGYFLQVNRALLEIFGYSEIELLSQTFFSITHPDDLNKLPDVFTKTPPEEVKTFQLEKRYLHKDGHTIWALVNISILRDEANQQLYSIAQIQDISDRKYAEEALRQSQARFENLATAAPGNIYSLLLHPDKTLEFEYTNRAIAEICEVDFEIILKDTGSIILDRIHPDDRAEYLVAVEHSASTLTRFRHEWRIVTPSGQIKWVQGSSQPELRPNGDICWHGVLLDISELKTAEEALRQSQQQTQAILSAIPDLMFLMKVDGTYLASIRSNHLVDVIPKDLNPVGKNIVEFLPTDMAQRNLQAIQTVISTGVIQTYEQQIQVGDHLRYEELRIAPCGPDAALTIIRDITARKEAEAALKESEERFQEIAETVSQFFFVRSAITGNYLYLSAAYEKIWGRSCESLYQDPESWLEAIHPDDAAFVQTSLEQQPTQPSVRRDYRIIRPDGSIRWVSAEVCLINDSLGNPLRYVGFAEDITDRKLAEQTLQEREYMLRTLADNLPKGLIYQLVHDPKRGYYFSHITAGIQHLLGIDPADVMQDANVLHSRILADDRAVLEALTEESRQNLTIFEMQMRKYTLEGQIQWSTLRSAPRRLPDGCTVWDGIELDISELKEAEQKLQQSKEAAEAASLAKSIFLANMSHELRTPLNAILGYAQLLSRDADITPIYQRYVDIINRNGEYLLQLINDVLSISKIEAGHIALEESDVDLWALLDTIEGLFHLRAETKGLRFSCDRTSTVPARIHTDGRKLRQVIVNMLDNAIKFTSQGQIMLHVDATPAPDRLRVEVSDTGIGIAPNELNDVFEAFVQSESGRLSQQGTGLGLSISRRFVQIMGGEITVESVVGQGSRFQFYIPLKPAVDPSEPPAPLRRVVGFAPDQPHYRVLVVDDIDTNRQLLVNWLTPVGFSVQEAKTGEEAIAQWQTFAPHLILMDMRMPVMDGFEAVRQIRALEQTRALTTSPTTKIIAITAAAFAEEQDAILAAGCNDIIGKPCSERIIFQTLATHLGVVYRYEEPSQRTEIKPSANAVAIARDGLRSMDADWLSQLNRAARSANERAIFELVNRLADDHSDLKGAIAQLIDNFQLDALIQLTQPPYESE